MQRLIVLKVCNEVLDGLNTLFGAVGPMPEAVKFILQRKTKNIKNSSNTFSMFCRNQFHSRVLRFVHGTTRDWLHACRREVAMGNFDFKPSGAPQVEDDDYDLPLYEQFLDGAFAADSAAGGAPPPLPPTSTVLPTIAEAVALPDRPAEAQLSDLLQQAAPDFAADPTTWILPREQWPNTTSRVYAGVQGTSPEQYHRLIRRMHAIRMVRFLPQPAVINSVFSVVKSGGSLGQPAQRLIIDARAVNSIMRTAPKVRLPTPSDLARIAASRPFRILSMDLDNYYHSLATDRRLHPYVCLPAVPAEKVKDLLAPRIGGWPDRVYPAVTTLPMGLGLSVYVGQEAHLAAIRRMGISGRMINDTAMPDPATGLWLSVYIDDCHAFAAERSVLLQTRQTLEEGYPRLGLRVKHSKTRGPAETATVLGVEIDGTKRTMRASPSKVLRAMRATEAILARNACSGTELRALLGHWIWLVLARRPALCCFHSCFGFVQRCGDQVRRLWSTVRSELRTIIKLAPLLAVSIDNNWFRSTVATDASEWGGGVVTAPLTPDVLASEIPFIAWRGAATSLNEAYEGHTMQQHDMAAAAKAYDWSTAVSTPWRWPAHINKLELEATILGVRWVLSHPDGFGSRLLMYSDSLVAVGAAAKGRSSSYHLNRSVRRLNAYLLASGLRVHQRWIPSASNPSDAASRAGIVGSA